MAVDASKYDALPMFPLPNFVLFPDTYTRLHIFEPRYKLMVADALDSERLLVLTGLQPGWEANYYGSPPVYPVGSLCSIVHDQRLEDGKFNLLVHCIRRVRLTQCLRLKPYRTGAFVALDDEEGNAEILNDATELLTGCIRALMLALGEKAGLLHDSLEATAHPNLLTHRVASVLVTDPAERQRLLETTNVGQRAQKLGAHAAYLLARIAAIQQKDRASTSLQLKN